jgi:hypothetical protein
MSNDDLQARLAAVEDRLALIELEAMYARTYDAREGEAWAALFTPDGIYQSRGASASGGGSFVQGRAALARSCVEAKHDGIHLMHLPQLTITGDRAIGRVHLEFAARDHGDDTHRRMVGYYDIEYARVDGRWFIKRRVTTAFARQSQTAFGYRAGSGLLDARG